MFGGWQHRLSDFGAQNIERQALLVFLFIFFVSLPAVLFVQFLTFCYRPITDWLPGKVSGSCRQNLSEEEGVNSGGGGGGELQCLRHHRISCLSSPLFVIHGQLERAIVWQLEQNEGSEGGGGDERNV